MEACPIVSDGPPSITGVSQASADGRHFEWARLSDALRRDIVATSARRTPGPRHRPHPPGARAATSGGPAVPEARSRRSLNTHHAAPIANTTIVTTAAGWLSSGSVKVAITHNVQSRPIPMVGTSEPVLFAAWPGLSRDRRDAALPRVGGAPRPGVAPGPRVRAGRGGPRGARRRAFVVRLAGGLLIAGSAIASVAFDASIGPCRPRASICRPTAVPPATSPRDGSAPSGTARSTAGGAYPICRCGSRRPPRCRPRDHPQCSSRRLVGLFIDANDRPDVRDGCRPATVQS